MAKNPKDLTYGQLVNIRTKLEMLNKAAGNKSSKHVLPDGTKLGIKNVENKIAKLNPKPNLVKPVPYKGMPSSEPSAKIATKKPTTKKKP